MAWFRRSPRPGPVPLEFRFFDDAQWRAFVVAVDTALRRMRVPVASLADGVVVLERGTTHGLLNLAQTCHLNPTLNWVTLADLHFRRIVSTLDGDPPAGTRDQLRVRLYPHDYFDAALETTSDFLWTPFAHGVLAAVVYDLPTSLRTAPLSEIAEFGNAEDVWSLAWQQTRSTEVPDEIEVVDQGGVTLHNLLGDNFFVASLVASLDDHISIGPHGALVAIPHRHAIVVHVIETVVAIDAVQLMVPIARRMYLEGPGSVSPHLYWWRNGTLVWQPCVYDEDTGVIEFHPTDDLLAVIDELPT